MAYVDKAAMILQFGELELTQLTDRDGSTGAIVDAVLGEAIAYAESEADSYLGAAYTLPLPTVPPVLSSMCGDIARYRLYGNKATEEVQTRYDRAVSWLRDVSKGVVSLGIKEADPQPECTVAVAGSRPQVFTDHIFRKMEPQWP